MVDNWEDIEDENIELPQFKETKKKPQTPEKIISDNSIRESHPYYSSQPQVKILTRKPNNNSTKPTSQVSSNQSPNNSSKSLQQREKDYAEARKRILGEEK